LYIIIIVVVVSMYINLFTMGNCHYYVTVPSATIKYKFALLFYTLMLN